MLIAAEEEEEGAVVAAGVDTDDAEDGTVSLEPEADVPDAAAAFLASASAFILR